MPINNVVKTPSVTLGRATGKPDPNVTFGTATKEVATGRVFSLPVIQSPMVTEQTLDQASDPSAPPILRIEELTGTQRSIVLTGRALPYRNSLKFCSEQEIDEGKYIGYPQINQTPLGAHEKETEMTGAWKDRFLGDGGDTQIAGGGFAFMEEFVPAGLTIDGDIGDLSRKNTLRSARDLCDLFQDVVYRARPIRFRWLHIRMVGRLTSFEQNWLNPHDVEWKMTFKWIGRDEKVAMAAPTQTTLVGLAHAFSSSYTDLHEATNFDDLADLQPDFADAVDQAVGKIQQAVTDVHDSLASGVAAVTDPMDALRRATTLATFVRDQAQDLIDTIDEAVAPAILLSAQAGIAPSPGSLSGVGDLFTVIGIQTSPGVQALLGVDLTGVDPGRAIAASCQQRAAVRAARAMRHTAARQRFIALRSLAANAIGVVMLHDRQDLRDLARDWYGNAGDGEQIRKYNHLTTYSPPVGTLVFIPAPGTVPR